LPFLNPCLGVPTHQIIQAVLPGLVESEPQIRRHGRVVSFPSAGVDAHQERQNYGDSLLNTLIYVALACLRSAFLGNEIPIPSHAFPDFSAGGIHLRDVRFSTSSTSRLACRLRTEAYHVLGRRYLVHLVNCHRNCTSPLAVWLRTVSLMVTWNQSSRCSACGWRYSGRCSELQSSAAQTAIIAISRQDYLTLS
jgi:hypothetical protein